MLFTHEPAAGAGFYLCSNTEVRPHRSTALPHRSRRAAGCGLPAELRGRAAGAAPLSSGRRAPPAARTMGAPAEGPAASWGPCPARPGALPSVLLRRLPAAPGRPAPLGAPSALAVPPRAPRLYPPGYSPSHSIALSAKRAAGRAGRPGWLAASCAPSLSRGRRGGLWEPRCPARRPDLLPPRVPRAQPAGGEAAPRGPTWAAVRAASLQGTVLRTEGRSALFSSDPASLRQESGRAEPGGRREDEGGPLCRPPRGAPSPRGSLAEPRSARCRRSHPPPTRTFPGGRAPRLVPGRRSQRSAPRTPRTGSHGGRSAPTSRSGAARRHTAGHGYGRDGASGAPHSAERSRGSI